MLREGEGEKLESIAASEKLPPPRVRQRVSRLRRHFKENWQREVALLAALGVIVSALVVFMLRKDEPDADHPRGGRPARRADASPRAREVRERRLEERASTGSTRRVASTRPATRKPEVQQARQAADEALKTPPPIPTATPTVSVPLTEPTGSVTPPPVPSGSSLPPTKTKFAPPAKPQSTEPPIPTPVAYGRVRQHPGLEVLEPASAEGHHQAARQGRAQEGDELHQRLDR